MRVPVTRGAFHDGGASFGTTPVVSNTFKSKLYHFKTILNEKDSNKTV